MNVTKRNDNQASKLANTKEVKEKKGDTLSKILASFTIKKLYNSALGLDESVEMVKYSCERIANGDMSDVESLLMTQAQTMNVLFQRCTSLILEQDKTASIQVVADIALRAQKQSAKTLKMLADLKHPKRTTFIQQQNNAMNQQINNSEN
ncbi:MAG: hypothetical protein COY58_09340 [Gammaproteobacteria bacterium CG_4_10_14_0_8_um_filter_38_16]|nr:MAG: hypothetical protein COY58_09340 [Gammaproteobacteria bacterium CG_4_10_14_0_8_um_filter_38_16]PJA03106.1 MAG: hypothetical protein COX72_07325 [Gammaproteobacteria bacterium CG_4_10_14_0_2_um_filter_38_22]PJB10274.1 MAG: hypothetical protein CO120_05580 [Gammaproteobacteria bacterium CG_4_9_14_3_um_filter_38_9]